MSDLVYKKTIKLNKALFDKWDRTTASQVRLFLNNNTSSSPTSSQTLYEKIIAKFIPGFLNNDLDVDFTDEEFVEVKRIYENGGGL